MSRIREVVYIYRPLVAFLGDDTLHDFAKRVATLAAPGFKVGAMAGNHGNGLLQDSRETISKFTTGNTRSFGIVGAVPVFASVVESQSP